MLDDVALAYGGFDSICVTAGVFWPSDTTGHIPDDKWAFTFGVNVTGSYIVGDEALKTWKEQGLKGQLVLTTSANAAVAKKGSRRLRLLKGRRQPPRARACDGARAARARERRRSRDRGAGFGDVPARPRHRLAREIQHSLHRRRSDRFAGERSWRNSTPTAR